MNNTPGRTLNERFENSREENTGSKSQRQMGKTMMSPRVKQLASPRDRYDAGRRLTENSKRSEVELEDMSADDGRLRSNIEDIVRKQLAQHRPSD